MADARLIVAGVLAGIALILAVLGMIGGSPVGEMQSGMQGHASLVVSHFGGLSGSHVPGVVALGLSTGSFLLT
jgi:hypothetical protein